MDTADFIDSQGLDVVDVTLHDPFKPVVDAEDVVLGRLSTRIATILRGKHRATFTPHVDCGDHVIVINAENYGERYVVDPKLHSSQHGWNRHPLLEAAIEFMQIPDDLAFEVTIYSEAPAGASTGTSAAVTVALVGALDATTVESGTVVEVDPVAGANLGVLASGFQLFQEFVDLLEFVLHLQRLKYGEGLLP